MQHPLLANDVVRCDDGLPDRADLRGQQLLRLVGCLPERLSAGRLRRRRAGRTGSAADPGLAAKLRRL